MPFDGKILIVDDEAHIRKFVGHVVRQLGSPVLVEAANGKEALVKYAEESPDLVLLDVNMPVMGGLQALQELLKRDPEAMVVMLTSLANRSTVEECIKTGAAGYIRKDTPKEAILASLSGILRDNFEEG